MLSHQIFICLLIIPIVQSKEHSQLEYGVAASLLKNR